MKDKKAALMLYVSKENDIIFSIEYPNREKLAVIQVTIKEAGKIKAIVDEAIKIAEKRKERASIN